MIKLVSRWAMAMLFAQGVATGVSATELRYATFVPPTSKTVTIGVEPTLDAITKDTNGDLTFKVYAGGQLLGGKEMLSGLSSGIADFGFVAPTYFVSQLKVNNVIGDMMAFGSDPVAVAGAMIETILMDCPRCQEEFAKNNLVYIGGYAPTAYRLMCSRPINSTADLKGLRMRGGGTAMSRAAAALGGVPVNLESSEMYEALQRGQLDCIVGPTVWMKQYSLGDVVKGVVSEPLGVLGGLATFTFNKDAWDNLSKDEQKAIYKRAGKMAADATIIAYMDDENKVDEAAKQKGLPYFAGDDALQKILEQHREAERAVIVKAATDRGVQKPEEIMAAYEKNLKKWRELSKSKIKGDAQAFAELLWTEVYSKVAAK